MKKNPLMVIILIGMGLITLALVGTAGYFFARSAGVLGASEGALRSYVQAEPVVTVGKQTYLVITVHNDSPEFVTVEEIRLPNSLIGSADVVAIVPGTMTHTDYDLETGYQVGFLMAPGDKRQFTVTLVPRQVDDLVGDVTVVAGKYQTVTGFRVIFTEPVAELPTDTPLPPTQTFSPTDMPVPETPTVTPSAMPYGGVVKITATIRYSSYLKPVWTGSGTVISSDGLILTNAHLITPGQGYRPDIWVVGITDDPALPPEDKYYADPLVVDEDLDIAVLQIITDLHYKPVRPSEMNLQVVPMGDSNQLRLGDPLIVIGYPGIGGETITLTRGDVGGFTASNQYGERSFIKTSAAISGGTSGGTALDATGHMVAIPTQLGNGGSNEELVDCRVIADTNGDGRVDERDVCVPVGGFINAMRPVNLAIPLIEQARAIIAALETAAVTTPIAAPVDSSPTP